MTAQDSETTLDAFGQERRQLLKIALVLLTSVSAGSIAIAGLRFLSEREVTAQTASSYGEAEPVADQLKAVATAVAVKGGETTFVPEGPFTKELYDRVSGATGIVRMKFFSDPRRIAGTVWVAAKDGKDYYIVTNKHTVTKFPGKVEQVSLWFPDKSRWLTPDSFDYLADTSDKDLAVMKVSFNDPEVGIKTPLVWKDHDEIREGERYLVVGYSNEFSYSNQPGSVVDAIVMGAQKSVEGQLVLRGKADEGASGSVVVDRNGVAVSTLVGRNDLPFRGEKIKQPAIFTTSLEIEDLIEALKK